MNNIIRYAQPMFLFLQKLPENRDKILQGFIDFERNLLQEGCAEQAVEHCKFALAALFDEKILRTESHLREEWLHKTLQHTFFGEHLAGERFFERLQKMRLTPLQSIDVLELYFQCLQLGFEGSYRQKDKEQLLNLQLELNQQILFVF